MEKQVHNISDNIHIMPKVAVYNM